MPLKVRDANLSDAENILAIYNYAVVSTASVWTEEPANIVSRRNWLRQRVDDGFPVLVAEADGLLAGFASFGQFRPWPGFRHTVENSIFVSPDFHRMGIGKLLMQALIGRGISERRHVMVACIEANNVASVRLHESLGFVRTALLPEVGTKFGEWLDLLIMQRFLLEDAPARLDGHISGE
jgi:phosphinothricin acetyltransferase